MRPDPHADAEQDHRQAQELAHRQVEGQQAEEAVRLAAVFGDETERAVADKEYRRGRCQRALLACVEPQDQERIEETFNAPVHQIYQCTEGLLAVSCVKGSLHIQEDVVIIQLEALPGSNGERVIPIVTDMWRSTQPIIRYRLNDVLQMHPQPCSCGSTFRVIRAIEGRCDDVCYFESLAGGARPFYPDTIRRTILLANPDITDYQAVQERCGHLRIHLSSASEAQFGEVAQSVLASVQTTVAQYGCRPAEVSIEEGLGPLKPGMKRRRVQARWNHPIRTMAEEQQ